MLKRLLFVCALVLVATLVVNCGGGGGKTDLPPAGGGKAAAGPAFDMSKATATLAGKIVFEGTPPTNPKIQMTADPYCASHAPNATAEEVLVKDGGLQNVMIYVKSGYESFGPFRAPAEPIVLDQKDCHYIPHVFTMTAGQSLKVKNSDSTLHNVHGWAEKNTVFNVAQPVPNMEHNFKLDKEEIPLPIRCDVHKWMNSFVGVFSHPFHTVSKEDGTFEIKVPAGKYEIVALHEKLGTQTTTIEVADNEKKELSFTYKASGN